MQGVPFRGELGLEFPIRLEGNFSGARNFLPVHRAPGDWTVHFRLALCHAGSMAASRTFTCTHGRLHNRDWDRLKAALQEAADSGLTPLDNAQAFEP